MSDGSADGLTEGALGSGAPFALVRKIPPATLLQPPMAVTPDENPSARMPGRCPAEGCPRAFETRHARFAVAYSPRFQRGTGSRPRTHLPLGNPRIVLLQRSDPEFPRVENWRSGTYSPGRTEAPLQ